MKKKLPLKIWLISAMLLVIAIVHVVMGLTGHGYQWIWIICCGVMSILYPILEMKLLDTPKNEASDEDRKAEAATEEIVQTEHVDDGFGDHIEEVVEEGLELTEEQKE